MNNSAVVAFIDAEIQRLMQARKLIAGEDGVRSGRRGRPPGSLSLGGPRRRRHMSAEARKRISEAQKKRWAARRKSEK
jgi:hypothetical protein